MGLLKICLKSCIGIFQKQTLHFIALVLAVVVVAVVVTVC